jgi:hypothetical protein
VVAIALCETDKLGETLIARLLDTIPDCVTVLYGVSLYSGVGDCVGVIVTNTEGEAELEIEAFAVRVDETDDDPLIDNNALVDTV